MKRLQIQTLKRAGLSARQVADRSGVGERTVRRVSAEDPVREASAALQRPGARLGRPSVLAPFEARIRQWLREDPRISTVAVLERLRGEGCAAGKSAVYEAVRGLRQPEAKPVVSRFEGLPGEFSQHDFGQVLVRYERGGGERIRFFASRLKYSRRMHVRLSADERTESVCRGLFDAFTFFGGVPLESVFDNPKTIVVERDGERVVWQETFAQFCAEAGIVPRVTWPASPEQKGAVENLVGFAKTSFFKVHRFHDREDLERKLGEWLAYVNDARVCRATGAVPRERWLEELPRLRPMGFGPAGYTLKYTRLVRTDGFVEHDRLRYFAGKDVVGQWLTLHVAEEQVALYHRQEPVARHPRRPLNGKYSILPEQRPQLLEKPGARPYAKRQMLLDLCPAAEWFLVELRHRRPLWWKEEVDQLFALLEGHGEAAVQAAFVETGRRGVVGVEYLQAILAGHAAEAER